MHAVDGRTLSTSSAPISGSHHAKIRRKSVRLVLRRYPHRLGFQHANRLKKEPDPTFQDGPTSSLLPLPRLVAIHRSRGAQTCGAPSLNGPHVCRKNGFGGLPIPMQHPRLHSISGCRTGIYENLEQFKSCRYRDRITKQRRCSAIHQSIPRYISERNTGDGGGYNSAGSFAR